MPELQLLVLMYTFKLADTEKHFHSTLKPFSCLCDYTCGGLLLLFFAAVRTNLCFLLPLTQLRSIQL